MCTCFVNVGRLLACDVRVPHGGGPDGDGVGVIEGVGVGVGVRLGVGVGVGVGVRVGVGVGVGDGVRVGVTVTVSVGDGDTVTVVLAESDGVTDGVGDGDGDGQFCCDRVESSPIGPSSSEPMFAVTEMHAMLRSHGRLIAAGSSEYGVMENSRWGLVGLGPMLPARSVAAESVDDASKT